MDSQFVNGFIANLVNLIPKEQIEIIANKLTIYTTDFEIAKKETSLSIYEEFPECAKAYLVTRKIEGLSDNSVKNYYGHLKRFFNVVTIPIATIEKKHIIKYISELKTSDRSKSATLTVLKTFFQWSLNEGYTEKNPCANIKPIKYKRKEPEHLTDIELEMLRGACRTLREIAIVEFFYATGCRVNEVIKLNKRDIDFKNEEVTVLGKGNKYRTVYLSAKTIIALKNYLESRTDDDEALFVTDFSLHKNNTRITSKNTYETIFKELGNRANITKYVHPHLMRHTTATSALEKGMPIEEVQKMLGHANINTTLIYAEVSDKSVKQSHKRCIL